MRLRPSLPSLLFLLLAALPAAASDGWDALAEPGTHAIMRHARAPGTGDPAAFTLGDCSTQRNLDETGRAQARQTGAAMRERGIAFSAVLTSQWCRAAETAKLMDIGTVTEEPLLNSFFGNRSDEPQQTAGLAERLKALGASDKAMLVTHQVNITALTGVFPQSGEIIVIAVGEDGRIDVRGRIMPEG